MKVKIFDMVLSDVPAGKSPATQLEDQMNNFFRHYPNLQLLRTHMNTLTVPADPAAPGLEAKPPSIIIFATVFYNT